MNIRDYDPKLGMAFQGDVSITPVPPDIPLDLSDEIAPVSGRLILQDGEVTGHHHAIDLLERPAVRKFDAVDQLMADASAGKIPLPTARLFRDPKAVEAMVRRGILTRADLSIGVLVVDVGPMCLGHEEHGGILLPHRDGSVVQPDLKIWPGGYSSLRGVTIIGRQVESAGAEERRVAD